MSRRRDRGREAAEVVRLHADADTVLSRVSTAADWAALLDVAARLEYPHPTTVALVRDRWPDAWRVADRRTWRALGFGVRAGVRGLRTVAPGGRGGEQRPVTLYSSAQLEDPPRWTPSTTPVAGHTPPGLWSVLTGRFHGAGFGVRHGADLRGRAAVTDWHTRTVHVRDPAPTPSAAAALAHELGHLLMHRPGDFTGECSGAVAAEAESFAYLVGVRHGLHPALFGLPAVDTWVGVDGRADTVRGVLGRALRYARAVHDQITSQAATSAERAAAQNLRDVVQTTRDRARAVAATARHDTTTPARTPVRAVARVREPVPHIARLLAAHQATADFYIQCLGTSAARAALAGLGFDFGRVPGPPWVIGYAPPGGHALRQHLAGHGFSEAELAATGLFQGGDAAGLVDQLQDRVVFGIRDHRLTGAPVVAYTGQARREPRYVTTGGNPLTHDTLTAGRAGLLYGLAEHTYLGPPPARWTPVLIVGPRTGPDTALRLTAAGAGHAGVSTPAGGALTDRQARAITTAPGWQSRIIVAVTSDPGHGLHPTAGDTLRALIDALPPGGVRIDALVLPGDPAAARPRQLADLLGRPLPRLDQIVAVDTAINTALRRGDHPAAAAYQAAWHVARQSTAADMTTLAGYVAGRLNLGQGALTPLVRVHLENQMDAAHRVTARHPTTPNRTSQRPALPTPTHHQPPVRRDPTHTHEL